MNTSDMTLVQAMAIFLFLARRHDSPRYVWMLTGLVIRMAQALGLHRDGSRFDHLTPFEVEKRRRIWWAVCVLDLRSSEELAMDMTIAQGSFDTRLPLNVNTSDIRPTTQQAPPEKDGLTDMTLPLLWFSQVDVMRRMTFLMAAQGGQAGSSLEEQLSLLGELEDQIQRMYLQYSNPQDSPAYWMAVGVTRIVVSKMTLFVYLPALFSSPANITQDISTKLLVSAIEIAEFNHALNGSRDCRPWRWIFQTYTHWHAVVYMLLNAAQQPWSPLIERAWVALHSSWLIPKDTGKALRARTWVPLRQLFSKARAHRDAELERLRGDQRAADSLYHEDMALEQPNSPGLGPFPGPMEGMAELFRQRWRQLVTATAGSEDVQPQQQQQQQQQQQGVVVGEAVDQTQLWTESLQLQLDTDMLFPAMSDGGESTYSFSDLDFDADVNAMNWGEWIQYTEEVERSAAAVAATVAR
ncbi:hypothetical protein VHEMI02843 [[Torrubiella] hemipterigena]|uniref:Xylanolytic transcriptional activator regulatory domain-containing protein n=1 Tax=[Torrubiella] hemipterigena TaxID=1531966 RepID=A0A0A1T9E2_9HYPO|nr:hypothetical protein VHEMI02843 [[Torrubiella] hemipterigena]